MNKKYYLIFDFGASNGRAAVAGFDGSRFDLEITHRFENCSVFAGGTLYWDILRLYSELKIGIQKSIKKYPDIRSLGVDTWGGDFGLLDSNGKLLSNPINYRDEQSSKDAESLHDVIPQRELFELTGASCLPFFDLYQLYSMKKNNSVALNNAKTFLSIGDIFNYFLTGITFNEFTRIATSVLFNQKELRMEDSIFERLGLSKEIFPELIYPGHRLGDITGDVAKELDIRPFPVIAPSSHDTSSAVAGIPIIDSSLSWAFMCLGTWVCLGFENRDVLISDEIFEAGFSNDAGVEDTNIFIKNINGLWIVQQCRKRWLEDKDLSWGDIVEFSEEAEPFASFIDVDHLQFAVPQSDMPEVILRFCQDTGQKKPKSIGEVARCVYESLTLKFKYCFEMLEKFNGKKFELIHLVGGGIQNRVLCQWVADATGKNVIAGPIETTVVGNLLMQMKADSEIKNIQEGRTLSLASSEVFEYNFSDKTKWDEAYDRYVSLIGNK